MSTRKLALTATMHCLTGCAIGEVLGMAIGTGAPLGQRPTIALAVVLAFVFGYAFTLVPLVRSGRPLARGPAAWRSRRTPRRSRSWRSSTTR